MNRERLGARNRIPLLLAGLVLTALLATMGLAGVAQAGVARTQVYQLPVGSEGVGMEKVQCRSGAQGITYIMFHNRYENYLEVAWRQEPVDTSGFQTQGGFFNVWTLMSDLRAIFGFVFSLSGMQNPLTPYSLSTTMAGMNTQGKLTLLNWMLNLSQSYGQQAGGSQQTVEGYSGTKAPAVTYGADGNKQVFYNTAGGVSRSVATDHTSTLDEAGSQVIFGDNSDSGIVASTDNLATNLAFLDSRNQKMTMLSDAWGEGSFTQILIDASSDVAIIDDKGSMASTWDAEHVWTDEDMKPAVGSEIFNAILDSNGAVQYQHWTLDGQGNPNPTSGDSTVLTNDGINVPVVFFNNFNQSTSVFYTKSDGEVVLATKPAGQDNFNLQHIDSLSHPTSISASAAPDGKVHAAVVNQEGGQATLFHYQVTQD